MILNRYIITNLFLIIIFYLCGLNVSAQNHTILIFDPHQVSTNFQNSFHQLSSDSLYVVDSLDENINNFDALFLFIRYPYVLSEEEGNRLIEYLNLNKPIYLYTNLYWQDVETVAFWNHIGINLYFELLAEVHVNYVVGVDTAFTKEVFIDTSFISGGIPYIDGEVAPILDGIPIDTASLGLSTTFIPEDNSLKVIIDLYNLIHHIKFLERVIEHFGLEEESPLIQFYPAVDTAFINGNATLPEIMSRNLASTPFRDSILIEPGKWTTFYYYDSTGTYISIDKFYFIVTDSSDAYDYELWLHPKTFPPFNPIPIPFDSSFFIEDFEAELELKVIEGTSVIDSLSKFFKILYGLDVNTEHSIPLSFKLSQNYPNPFNPNTTIKYQIPVISFVIIKVYDVLGNEVSTLVNEEKPAGSYEVEFDGTELTSGIYFYRIEAGSFVETKNMTLLK